MNFVSVNKLSTIREFISLEFLSYFLTNLRIVCSKESMVALKLSRESYNHKEDNLLDAVAYLGALNNLHNEI